MTRLIFIFQSTGQRAMKLIFTSLVLFLACGTAHAMTVAAMRCEGLENPLGIDAARPRLSWKLESNQRGQKQSAYEILVAGEERGLRPGKADLWDSGKVVSDDTAE